MQRDCHWFMPTKDDGLLSGIGLRHSYQVVHVCRHNGFVHMRKCLLNNRDASVGQNHLFASKLDQLLGFVSLMNDLIAISFSECSSQT